MEKIITVTTQLMIGKNKKKTKKWFDINCQEKLQYRQKKGNIMI